MNEQIHVIAEFTHYCSGHGESDTAINVLTDQGFFFSREAAEACAKRKFANVVTLTRAYSDNDL